MPRAIMLAVLLGCLVLPNSGFAGSWVDDWLTQKSSSGPGYYEGQKRGYATAGSFSARWQSGVDYPISVTPPSFSAGCGGIDFFGGSVSFLNMDMLVEKLQRILQNSAGIAFNMALETVCPKCANIMNVMESISNQLNSMSMNDCQMAKGLTIGVKNLAQSSMDAYREGTLGTSMSNNLSEGWEQAKRELTGADGTNVQKGLEWLSQKMAKPSNSNPLHEGCPLDALAFFPATTDAQPVYVLQVIGTKLGLLESHVNTMRGLVGDIVISNGQTGYQIVVEAACTENATFDSGKFARGELYVKPAGGACAQATGVNTDVVDYVAGMMTTISTKMRDKGALTAGSPEENFIINSPLPISYALKLGLSTGQTQEMIGNLAGVTADVYLAKSISDLASMIDIIMQKSAEANAKAVGHVNPMCWVSVNTENLEKQQGVLRQRIGRVSDIMRGSITKKVDEFSKVITVATYLEEINSRLHSDLRARFGLSVAQRALKKS